MNNNKDYFPTFAGISLALHLLLGYFFLFGLPSFFNRLPEEEVVTFEILPIDKISNIQTKKVQKQEEEVNQDAKASKQNRTKPVEEETKPKPKEPVPEVKPEPKPELPKEQKPKPKEPVPEVKPELPKEEKPKEVKKAEEIIKKETKKDTKPKQQKTKKDNKPPKKPEVKPKTKETGKTKSDNNLLDSILKDLEASSEGNNAKSSKHNRSEKTDNNIESKGKYNEDLELSISEADLIKQQIDKHWWRPTGVDLNGVKIILYIAFDKDGTVLQVRVKDRVCAGLPDSTCQALADSAKRAVLNASPIQNLNPERYEIWKEVEELVFSP